MKEEETKISDLKSNERREVTGLEKGREGRGGWAHEYPRQEGKDASEAIVSGRQMEKRGLVLSIL